MVNRTLSLGLYLSRICYLLNFLNLYIPLWLRKFFKFMVFRLLKKAFASQQTKSRHFYSCPLPPWAKLSPKFLLLPWYTGRLLISPGSICSKISPPKQKEGGENYEIKSDRIWSRRKAVIWATIKAILMTIIVGRWFLTPLFNEDPPEDLPPPPPQFFSNPSPALFLLPSFFRWIRDHAISNELFYWMIWQNYNCRALVPYTRSTLLCVLCNKASSLLLVWHRRHDNC